MAPRFNPPEPVEYRPLRKRDIKARYERLRDWRRLQRRGSEGLARGLQLLSLFRHGDCTTAWAKRVDDFLAVVWPEEFE